MQAMILDRSHMLSTKERETLQRRLLFALSRFSAELRGVEAVVVDQNGPRGGVDKQLRLKARLRNGATLTVVKRDRSVIAAASHAASRLASLVTRTLATNVRVRPPLPSPLSVCLHRCRFELLGPLQ